MNRVIDVATSIAASVSRFGVGARVGVIGARPEKTLELYDFESCPFCRKAREALSILDLDVRIWPCPKGGKTYREQLQARGGKQLFPYLVDPNTGKEMYESADIVEYLFQQYGTGAVPPLLASAPLSTATSSLASLMRPFAVGRMIRPARVPELPLALYSFEPSPFCRIVRELLSSLEIPYLLHNVAKGSAGRDAFVERSGKMMVPYLVDPNTDTEMFESAAINQYLIDTYAETV